MGGYGAGESARSPIVSSDGNGLERRIQGGMICGGAHEGAHSQLREETRSRDRPRSRTWNGEGSGGLGGAADALTRPSAGTCRHLQEASARRRPGVASQPVRRIKRFQ